jgi:hypothetical protein
VPPGHVLRDLGDLSSARTAFQHAVRLNPESADDYNNLACVCKDLGALPENATGSCRRAVPHLKPAVGPRDHRGSHPLLSPLPRLQARQPQRTVQPDPFLANGTAAGALGRAAARPGSLFLLWSPHSCPGGCFYMPSCNGRFATGTITISAWRTSCSLSLPKSTTTFSLLCTRTTRSSIRYRTRTARWGAARSPAPRSLLLPLPRRPPGDLHSRWCMVWVYMAFFFVRVHGWLFYYAVGRPSVRPMQQQPCATRKHCRRNLTITAATFRCAAVSASATSPLTLKYILASGK